MRVDEIRRLVELVEESRIDELEVRKWWGSVRISKVRRPDGRSSVQVVEAPAAAEPGIENPGPAPDSGAGSVDAATVSSADDQLSPIVAPMVGTFYRAPSPTAPPYIEVGARVKVGQVVCLVEAMKLMNEIESEVAGTVIKVQAENEQPVEFNQPLFLVRPDA